MKLSPHEMAYLLKWAGIPDAELQTGVAIGIAESDGETDVMGRSTTGANVGQRDHGWIQVSGRWQWDKLIKFGNFRDPWANALMATAIFNEAVKAGHGGWTPWATFNNGSHLKWMVDAAFGVAHPFPPPKMTSSVDLAPVLSALTSLTNIVGKLALEDDAALAAIKKQLDDLRAQLATEAGLNYTGTITLAPKA